MTQLLPPEKEQTQYPLGMARIINAKEVLQLYASAFPEDEMQLEVSDKQLSVNNGYYYLCNGKCMYSTERLPGAHIPMNISELTTGIIEGQISRLQEADEPVQIEYEIEPEIYAEVDENCYRKMLLNLLENCLLYTSPSPRD